jgi:DNA-binding GntR family transcriptional regulator
MTSASSSYSLLRICSYRTASVDDRPRIAALEHLAIVEAIERRDPEAAEANMRIHIANARDNFVRTAREPRTQSS